MSKPEPACYRTTNWKSYNDALKPRGSLLIWLDKDRVWLAPRADRNGSQRDPARHPAPWASHLEAMDRLSCPKSDQGKDAMPEILRRTHRLTSPRPPDRQTAEIHIRIALMNRFNELGMAEIERVA